jgi:Na+/proline symporter
MSLLELFGIVFLAMVIINSFVGIWAVKTADDEEEYTVSYSSSK